MHLPNSRAIDRKDSSLPGYQKRLTLYVLNVEVEGSYLEAIDRRDSNLQGYQKQLPLYALDVEVMEALAFFSSLGPKF